MPDETAVETLNNSTPKSIFNLKTFLIIETSVLVVGILFLIQISMEKASISKRYTDLLSPQYHTIEQEAVQNISPNEIEDVKHGRKIFSDSQFSFSFTYPDTWYITKGQDVPVENDLITVSNYEKSCAECTLDTKKKFMSVSISEVTLDNYQMGLLAQSDGNVSTFLSQDWVNHIAAEKKRCAIEKPCVPNIPGKYFDYFMRVDKLFPFVDSAAEVWLQGQYIIANHENGLVENNYYLLTTDKRFDVHLVAPENSWMNKKPAEDELERIPLHPLIEILQSIKLT